VIQVRISESYEYETPVKESNSRTDATTKNPDARCIRQALTDRTTEKSESEIKHEVKTEKQTRSGQK
jgi:hypothetical protein